jgi:hypothetical protein
MTSPRFSVVIPTREGASTLKHSLRTCLEQDFDDFEVVVCDNCSSPATRQVVQDCSSARIQYVRSETPLSMSSNWELAVSQAAGQYVTVLGDDDALLPHALRVLDHLITRSAARAIRWEAAFYLWPTIALPEEANYLRLPTASQIKAVDARQTISAVIRFEQCYSTLPMLYNSVVERSLLDELRQRAGRLFLTRYPDVCSGFMVASALSQYLSSDLPMSIAGLSHKSVGVGHHMIPTQNAIGQDFLRLNNGEGVKMGRLVPDLHVFPVVPVADCFQAVKEACFPEDELALDRKTLVYHCVSCLRTESEDHWRQCMATIRETLVDNPELTAWFDERWANQPPNVSGHLPLRSAELGFDSRYLHLDTAAFGIQDVCGAAQLCDRLLGLRGADLAARCEGWEVNSDGLIWPRELQEKEAVIQDLASASRQAQRELQEKEAVIQTLADQANQRLQIIRVLESQLAAALAQPTPPPTPPTLPTASPSLLGRVARKLKHVRDRWRGAA